MFWIDLRGLVESEKLALMRALPKAGRHMVECISGEPIICSGFTPEEVARIEAWEQLHGKKDRPQKIVEAIRRTVEDLLPVGRLRRSA